MGRTTERADESRVPADGAGFVATGAPVRVRRRQSRQSHHFDGRHRRWQRAFQTLATGWERILDVVRILLFQLWLLWLYLVRLSARVQRTQRCP